VPVLEAFKPQDFTGVHGRRYRAMTTHGIAVQSPMENQKVGALLAHLEIGAG